MKMSHFGIAAVVSNRARENQSPHGGASVGAAKGSGGRSTSQPCALGCLWAPWASLRWRKDAGSPFKPWETLSPDSSDLNQTSTLLENWERKESWTHRSPPSYL